MIETGFDSRVKVQQVIESQVPEFVRSDFPKYIEFLRQYYVSQEYQGGPVDIAENLDQYLRLDNITPEVISGVNTLTYDITTNSGIVTVTSTRGYPSEYGLLKIDDEIITYTGITTNTFTGCVRGFCGITEYNKSTAPGELVFSNSESASHTSGSNVVNLSALFLKEFYDKIRFSITPGLEKVKFTDNLDVSNFVKEARAFYQAKGTSESYRILFKVLYNEEPKVLDLEQFLFKPSSAELSRKEVVVAERLSGNPLKLLGQTVRRSLNPFIESSVSSVEVLTRSNKTYYKLSLFVGYNEDVPEGEFIISGKTRVLKDIGIGETIIPVDSTIGFPKSGKLISGNNIISYTDKTVNEFLGCTGVIQQINIASDIRSEETIFGYEDGDETKKVELRITGVLSSFVASSDEFLATEGEKIFVRNLGEVIKNPNTDKTYKEIVANSLIYNTSSRYYVKSISGSNYKLTSLIDKSSLKKGDFVDVLLSGSNTVVISDAEIINVDLTINSVELSASPSNLNLTYDIRRKIKYATSSGADLTYGDNKNIASIQNFYVNTEYGYIAANSLPNYDITFDIIKSSIPVASGSPALDAIGQGFIQGFNSETASYSIISFPSNTDFKTGDAVVYNVPTGKNVLDGLILGRTYYVEVDPLNDGSKNKIRLYTSRSFIGSSSFITFYAPTSNDGGHTFILEQNSKKTISPQKILRKIPLTSKKSIKSGFEVSSGSIGILVNGVEIISPKSDDKIYYGPLTGIDVFNGGSGYDVVRPPKIEIDAPKNNPSGQTASALASLVLEGEVKEVFVDPQSFPIDSVVSVTIDGGNGKGAILKPIVSKKQREIEFDARTLSQGGGVDVENETITTKTDHLLFHGDEIIYSSNGNNPLGISTLYRVNDLPLSYTNRYQKTLVNGAKYIIGWVNPKTVVLYESFSDFKAGINTVGITTENNIGVHKFRTPPQKTLSAIKVENPGSGYQNRQLYVTSSGISSATSTIHFKNHNFKNGDLVVYNHVDTGTGSTAISGLSSSTYYYVLKTDSDTFQLANAGKISIGATISDNFQRNNFVKLTSNGGNGYHIFKYPDISVSVVVSFASTNTGVITATPVVTGKIIDCYLYESGLDYGSNILNLERDPSITFKAGKNAEVVPIINDGRITSVQVLTKGQEYYSSPELKIYGSGTGASLRPVIVDNKLVDVIVANSGIGYSTSDTKISVVPRGKAAKLKANVRSLTVNNQFRFNDEILLDSGENKLKYGLVAYSPTIGANEFKDTGTPIHSPIIGWAYDGCPIYGPYGYSNPSEQQNARLLNTGYSESLSNIKNRPSSSLFPSGYFIEDFIFDGSGDLDAYNGRFCKTPEFPEGTYAYFAGIQTNFGSNTLQPKYPYFIGNQFKYEKIKENEYLDQSFDFNSSGLSRNTFPYKVADESADYEFVVESNEIINQLSIVKSVTSGIVDNVEILSGGDLYKVNDRAIFFPTSSGEGLDVIVSSVKGKDVNYIETETLTYTNALLEWTDKSTVTVRVNPYHEFKNLDNVIISGVTTSITKLAGSYPIGFTSESITLQQNLNANAVTGFVTDIYVSRIPEKVSIGSSIVIDGEVLTILNIFEKDAVLRVRRQNPGVAHTQTAAITILSDSFTIPVSVDYFISQPKTRIYFNPHQSIGIGTTPGISVNKQYRVGNVYKNISIPTQSIYIPNHPFKTGQQVKIGKVDSVASTPITVAITSTGTGFHFPPVGIAETTAYIVNQSKDYIGFTTVAGISSQPVYITEPGSDQYDYYFEPQYEQVRCQVQRIKARVGVNTYHNLLNNDSISLKVKPNLSVGVGTTASSISVRYDSAFERLIINERVFSSTDIDSSTSSITILRHGFTNKDKVLYRATSPAGGLVQGEYYVYVVDINTIKLCETLKDFGTQIPRFITISASGSNHKIGLINPQITRYLNNDLVFDVQHPSLSGYEFKIFEDGEFKNEFVSAGGTSTFNVERTSTSVTLKHSDLLPSKLYYALEKNGFISTSDTTVKFSSEIVSQDSIFSQSYSVFGVVGSSSTTFNITLKSEPERYFYDSSNCDLIEYSVSTENATGKIDKLKILNNGFGYKELPVFSHVESDDGFGATLIARSKSIGNINSVQILEQGFEYPSDKTLNPEASISPISIIKDAFTVESVGIVTGGKNYATPPKLIIVDEKENIILEDSNLEAVIASGSIVSVNVLAPINGLSLAKHRVLAVENSNGVFISSISKSGTDIVCTLATPIVGFFTDVFKIGDQIFVEGVEKVDGSGTGFNSQDYNWKFFTVKNYIGSNPAKVIFNLDSLTANVGTAKTIQEGYGVIVKRDNYPTFELNQTPLLYFNNEPILTDNGNGFIERDAKISESSPGYFKVIGPYVPTVGETVKGLYSGSVAKVTSVIENSGRFVIEFSNVITNGWDTEDGKLNASNQVTPDNDYYQNLSYSVKSSIEYETMTDTVNGLLHTSGLKNFADTQIERGLDKVSYGSTTEDVIRLDVIEDRRVDTINNFDLARDIYIKSNKSRYIKLENKTLSDYFICLTNRVLRVDDISGFFLNKEALSAEESVDVDNIDDPYQQYLIQITDPESKETQITEVVVLEDGSDNVYTFEKASLATTLFPTPLLGEVLAISDPNIDYLSIKPADLYDTDYDYKILKQKFTSQDSTGIGTQYVGFVDITSVNSFAGIGATATILSRDIGKIDSAYLNVFLKNTTTNILDYVEIFVDHNSTDTFISEYFANTQYGISSNLPGSFDASIESGKLVVKFTNNSTEGGILVLSNIVGFGSTSVGIATYRFKDPVQLEGTERTARFISSYNVATGISTTILSTDLYLDGSAKSVVKVSYGQTSALHQVLMAHNEETSVITQFPFLSIGSTSGIGTFGSDIQGNKVLINFYPDPNITGEYSIRSFNEVFYRDSDLINLSPALEYGNSSYEIILSQYNSINGERRETSAFDLRYEGIPIFKKQFTPYDTNQVDFATGIIKIKSHFFQTGEALLYNPTSTFPGISAYAVGIGSTLNSSGISTDILPSTVYAIKIDENNLRLSTRKDYALAGIYVTFTSAGGGNAHELEMSVKDTKTLITLNGVVQKPLTYTPIAYNLTNNNGGSIGIAQTFISLTGIATVQSGDFLKVDNEYMIVRNVGLGTTNDGPIVGVGTYKLLEVRRGSVGTSATVHTDGTLARIHRGAYTIGGTKIYFSNTPKGNAFEKVGLDNLLPDKDQFTGRVYLRQDYAKNILYDDISDQFTGIGQTFEITVQGVSTTGIETGSGVLFLNDIYQTPSTSNNSGNNYSYFENASKTYVNFTGITSTNGQIIVSDLDVNQNQLPRGGVIVAFGATNGLGFAPLVGVPTSHIELKVGAGGTILSAGFTTAFIVGAALTCNVGITTEMITGIATGSLRVGQRIQASTGIIQNNTGITTIGIGSIFINKLTLNSVGIGTTLTFEGGVIYGSGYYGSTISIGVTDYSGVGTGGVISGVIGAGGSIVSFSVSNPGYGYTSPYAMVPDPSYDNLSVIGVSRLAVGATTDTGKGLLVTLEVGPASLSTVTGIGSTLFEIKSFKVTRPGYNFEVGDVFKPVGLVTASGLSQPIEEFELSVIEIFDDSFALWQFGELDYIDSISLLQDGVRTRFPLYYNSQLLSIEVDPNVSGSSDIDLDTVLIIFINGVLQEPGVAYEFTGGTSFTFIEAPGPEDKVSIYFYRGTRDVDSKLVNITETIKNGDTVELYGSDAYPIQQEPRFVYNIDTSDVIETNLYSGIGITESVSRPLYWTKQKSDRVLNGDLVYKSRDSIEAQIYPTAKVIKNITSSSTEIFVDDASFFKIEESDYGSNIDRLDLLITPGIESEIQTSSGILGFTPPRSAKLSTTISSGQVSSVSIIDGGFGYDVSSLEVKFSRPPSIDYAAISGNINPAKVGIGSTATAIANVFAGIVTSITITSPGYGYTLAPQALVSVPNFAKEKAIKVTGANVYGFSGIITGITTTAGIGTDLALKFFLQRRSPGFDFSSLENGYPIYITGTQVGFGITSIDTNDSSVVGLGTTCVDNIYYIKAITKTDDRADITCNIHSKSQYVGIATTGTKFNPVGSFSWGRITNLTRSTTNPLSIGVTGLIVDSGLSTFPTVQRRQTGLRDIGAVKKKSTVKFDNPTVK